MNYRRMPIEEEAPEEVGTAIKYNLSESAISDQTLTSLDTSIPANTILTYTEHKGSKKCRELIAAGSSSPDKQLTADEVLLTAGASTSLFIILTTLLGPDDHLVVTRPNYATNLEIPHSIGCHVTFVDLLYEEDWRINVDRIAAEIRPGVTKLVSICSPNNPTGTVVSELDMVALASLTLQRGCHLLVDETYRELVFDGVRPSTACFGDHVVTVSSMSKAYGVPGIRVGWLISTQPRLQVAFLAAKEQISISGSVIDELIAQQILDRRDVLLRETVAEMRRRRDYVAGWVEQNLQWVEWVRPEAGVMCLIRVKKPIGQSFYEKVLGETGVYVGRGGWFDLDECYFRLGYGWPTWDDLTMGLGLLAENLASSS
jgi:aspartate/methionine/tyrosine aminotransferase